MKRKIIIKNKLRNVSINEIEIENINLKKTKRLISEIIDSEIEKIPEILINYGFQTKPITLLVTHQDNLLDTYQLPLR